ncbi:MAG: MMPL family transporter [Phycisphaerales bacterium]|nr:MAG: MMPL family transporter [Phycisphaerales bacterium]
MLTAVSTALLFRPGLKQDYRIEAFVAGTDDSYRRFRRFMETFGGNEFAIIAVHGNDALSPETLALLAQLGDEVRGLKSVDRVVSLAEIPAVIKAVLGDRLRRHPLFVDNIISRDGRSAAVLLQMAGEDRSGDVRKPTVTSLRAIVAGAQQAHPDLQIILAGPYVTLIDMFDYIQRDLVVFTVAAFVLLGLTLWLVFRRPAPMLFAIAVGASATVCTLGLAVVCGFVTSLITQMIVILVAVLSVANCVHLAVAAEETSVQGPATVRREQAMRTLARMVAPCTAVIATTAVGFAAVCTSSISPIRLLGMLMVFGLAWSLVTALAATVVVSGVPPSPRARLHLPGWLRRLGAWSDRRRRLVFLLFAASTAFCAVGARSLRFESAFLENFRAHTSVRQAYNFISEKFAPVGSMEVIIQSRDGRSVVTPDMIQRAAVLADDAVERYDCIRKAQTIGDVLTLFHETLPRTELDLNLRLAAVRAASGERDALRTYVNEDRTAMRISLRAREGGVGVHEKIRIANEIRDKVSDAVGKEYSVEVTGLYCFYAHLIRGLLRDQYRSVAITIPAVFLVIILVMRSWRVAAVAMIPNLLPVIFCLGAMGWSGIPVNMTTALMLSVTFGIAVDDTLHYLWHFREALADSGDYRLALLTTHAGVGRACVFTTVVIAGGFWILVLSEFVPTAYFGGLVGFTMLATLAADLVLLPALLTTLRPFRPEKGTAAVSPVSRLT